MLVANNITTFTVAFSNTCDSSILITSLFSDFYEGLYGGGVRNLLAEKNLK